MPPRPTGTLRLLLRPSLLLLHVAGVVAVVAAVLLGRWQVGAWQEHRQDRAAELADADPVPLDDVLGPDDAFPGSAVGQPVEVVGRWLPEETVHVADKVNDGRTGSWTVTPLSTCAGAGDTECTGPVVPVVLGWSTDRTAAPALAAERVEVTGWLQPGEGSGGGDADPADDVLPTLRVADLLQRLDRDLYGGFVILRDPASARGDLQAVTPASLPKAPTFTALRNLLYGIEWWLFGGFALFLWWRWTRDELEAARAAEATTDPEAAGPTAEQPRIPSEP